MDPYTVIPQSKARRVPGFPYYPKGGRGHKNPHQQHHQHTPAPPSDGSPVPTIYKQAPDSNPPFCQTSKFEPALS